MVVDFRLGEVIRLKKPHPCGEDRWEIVRLGADIGLRCLGCRHRVLLERRDVERRLNQRFELEVDINRSLP